MWTASGTRNFLLLGPGPYMYVRARPRPYLTHRLAPQSPRRLRWHGKSDGHGREPRVKASESFSTMCLLCAGCAWEAGHGRWRPTGNGRTRESANLPILRPGPRFTKPRSWGLARCSMTFSLLNTLKVREHAAHVPSRILVMFTSVQCPVADLPGLYLIAGRAHIRTCLPYLPYLPYLFCAILFCISICDTAVTEALQPEPRRG